MGSRSVDSYIMAHYDNENTLFGGQKNETVCGLKILLIQRTQLYYFIDEATKITNVKTNENSESLDSFIQTSFPFEICDISLPLDKTGSVYFLLS